MNNKDVAHIFRGIAELLELKGDNPFRIRAYARAADTLDTFPRDVEELTLKELTDIPGIGKDLSLKIDEIIGTGKCAFFEELKRAVPEGVVRMLEIPGVGPKTAKLFYDQLKITSIDALEDAAKKGDLLALPGIKEKTVANVLEGIALVKKGKERMDILTATEIADLVVGHLKKSKAVKKAMVAGSLRRMKETVRDIDILVTSAQPEKAMRSFLSWPMVHRVLAEGDTKSAILTKEGVQVDLRVLEEKSFGAGLLYFTGSKEHNVKLRQRAIKKGWKVNEYGLFDAQEHCLAARSEKDVYQKLGLKFIEPELREECGEIEAAASGTLPRLIRLNDLRGDLHVHTDYSDGRSSLAQMVRGARALGYAYVCLTDHSESLKVAGGLDKRALKKKKAEIDELNKKLKGFRILFGSEVEIDAEGGIDYDKETLAQFDVVIGAIHSGFKQSKEQLTRRVVKACQHPYVHLIAHPTGRLWPTRPSYDLDMGEVFKVCRETNTALELSAHPYRLDLKDVLAREAKDKGVRLAINTDSHDVSGLSYMRFGIGTARRAWLEPRDVLNHLSWPDLLKAIKK